MFTPKLDLLLKRLFPLALAGLVVLALAEGSSGADAERAHATQATPGINSAPGGKVAPCSWAFGRAL